MAFQENESKREMTTPKRWFCQIIVSKPQSRTFHSHFLLRRWMTSHFFQRWRTDTFLMLRNSDLSFLFPKYETRRGPHFANHATFVETQHSTSVLVRSLRSIIFYRLQLKHLGNFHRVEKIANSETSRGKNNKTELESVFFSRNCYFALVFLLYP